MEFEDPAVLDDLLIGLPGFAAVHGLCPMPGGLAVAEASVCASAAASMMSDFLPNPSVALSGGASLLA
jgi:hypothetical protein